MSGFIDFHSHVLPGIDDGSKSSAESIELLQMEAAQGITHVVATPHFYPLHDQPERFLRRRAHSEARLREVMRDHEGLPELTVGAEVYYFPGMSDSDVISELTIGTRRCILIEMPPAPWTDVMYRELENIYVKRSLLPIVAHVDRYVNLFSANRIFQRLADLPVMVQVNGDFFLNRFTSSAALRLLKKDQIQLLGSDCHNLQSRKPNLGDALKIIEKHAGFDTILRLDSYGQELLHH